MTLAKSASNQRNHAPLLEFEPGEMLMQENTNVGPSLANTGSRPFKVVYAITERKDGKSWWTRIGAAFTNRDGSMTLKLDCVPLAGTMQVRDPEPRDADREPRTPSFGAAPTVAHAGF